MSLDDRKVALSCFNLSHHSGVASCYWWVTVTLDLSAVRAQPFLEGKVFADPEFGKSGRVDMLVSMADFNRCILFLWMLGLMKSYNDFGLRRKYQEKINRSLYHDQEEVPGEDQSLSLP